MLTVLLPAYNEEEALSLLIPRIHKALKDTVEYQVLVVDDGSIDETANVVKELQEKYPVHLICHEKNSGLGAAMRTGLKAAIESSFKSDSIIAMDADNTHNPELIPCMLKKLKHDDIVIASRYADGGEEIGLSFHRKLFSLICNRMLKLAFPISNCYDYTCGYRAYRSNTIKKGFSFFGNRLIEETSFVCMAELLIKLASTGANVNEVGLKLRYDLKHGPSKMRVVQTILKYLRLILLRNRIINDAKATNNKQLI